MPQSFGAWSICSFLTVVSLLAPALLSGCTTYTTPDGVSLWSADGPAAVRSKLGEPDTVDRRDAYYMGPYVKMEYTYLDRGYRVHFVNDRARGTSPIRPEDAALERRRAEAYAKWVALLQPGATVRSVVDTLGPPDRIQLSERRGGFSTVTYEGPDADRLLDAPEEACAWWKDRWVFAAFDRGRLTSARALLRWDWTEGLGEAPSIP